MTQPYFPGQYPPPMYQPPPVYEGLTKRQKRSAAWAGALGLNLMSFGGGVLFAAVLVGILVAAFAGFSSSAAQGSGMRGFDRFLAESGAGIWLVVAAVVGVVVFLIGMFVSAAILRTGGIRRPFAVTWSAFGVSLPLLAILSFVGGTVAQVFGATTMFAVSSSGSSDAGTGSPATIGIVLAIVAYLLSVAVVGVIGWLAWWWMSHLFRERIPVAVGVAHPRGGNPSGGGDGGYPVAFDGSGDGGGDGGGGGGGD